MSDSWLSQRLEYIRGLKSPSDQQRLLLLLSEKSEKSKDDDRKIAALVKAERAADRAQRARAAAARVVAKEADGERKARTRRLIELGGLVEIAGAGSMDRGTLLGLIAHGLEAATDERLARWKAYGDHAIADRESSKGAGAATGKGRRGLPTPPAVFTAASEA